jgi:hypothetical protein
MVFAHLSDSIMSKSKRVREERDKERERTRETKRESEKMRKKQRWKHRKMSK